MFDMYLYKYSEGNTLMDVIDIRNWLRTGWNWRHSPSCPCRLEAPRGAGVISAHVEVEIKAIRWCRSQSKARGHTLAGADRWDRGSSDQVFLHLCFCLGHTR